MRVPKEKYSQKQKHFGIETVPSIVYQAWESGKEYTKQIVLKNVNVKTQKVTFSSPNTRFFSTLYPKQVTLSAGTSFSLPITFRPLERTIYEDAITFTTKEGEFVVNVRAVLPVFHLVSPPSIKLPLCAVKDEVLFDFSIQNKSELVTPFQWDVAEPFYIEPSQGVIQPHSTLPLTVYFRPTAACVYECTAICLYGNNNEYTCETELEGISKYPHLMLSTVSTKAGETRLVTELDLQFPQTAIGQITEQIVEIFNRSQVEAKITLQQPSKLSNIDQVFYCDTTRAVIPPKDSTQVRIRYDPGTCSLARNDVDYIYISSISEISKSTIKCIGCCTGPEVNLSASCIDFSVIDVGQSQTRTFEITNNSATSTEYQFRLDCAQSVFKFDKTHGSLRTGETHKIVVKFWPRHAMNFHRQITCVVKDQHPLFIDLIGTAHSETVKPAVLSAHHLEQFNVHAERGLSLFPPEHLNEMVASGQLGTDQRGFLLNPQPPTQSVVTPSTSQTTAEAVEPYLKPQTVPAYSRFFDDGYHSDIVHTQPLVSLDSVYVNFGECYDVNNIQPQTVRLTNHTHGKLIVQWMDNPRQPFEVSPQTFEIPPQKTADFRVIFTPKSVDTLYGNELECYCYYKSLRDYRLVESITHAPPICVTVTVLASTFMKNQVPFLPEISFARDSLVFPPTNMNEPSYRSLVLTNNATTPVVFNFPNSEIFSVKPKSGIIRQGSEILTFKAVPNESKTFKRMVEMQLNYDNRYAEILPAVCAAETADILLTNNGELFFQPTCMGSTSTQRYSIKNISRVPLNFTWAIRSADRGLVAVEPAVGVIQPNEHQEHVFTFTPNEEKRYVMKPTVVVQASPAAGYPGGKQRAFPVRVIGEGTTGLITCEQDFLDFGDQIVGSAKSQTFTLANPSDCALAFKLTVESSAKGNCLDTGDHTGILQLEKMRGTIPARSKTTVRATVKPVMRAHYTFHVKYQLLLPGDTPIDEPQLLTQVFVMGVFPTMCITDARIYGSGIGIGKKQLWNLFQLDNMNMFLDSDPSEKELRYSVQTRNSTRKRPPVLTRAIVDFNFSAAPLDSEPCLVSLRFENTGSVACEWDFLFPSDLQIDLEYWSEDGNYTDTELHEMKVMDNKLFNISPKKGILEPGETTSLTFTYRHLMTGTNRVPILLKLSRGREIMVNFIGVTVEPERPYIHFPTDSHIFAPVPIGETKCPKQLYELYNGGSIPVTYEIGQHPLEQLEVDNFNHPVVKCLTLSGTIQPGKTCLVEWIFHPLESKTYQVDVPVYISGGDTAMITFTGVGFDKKVMGDTMAPQAENSNSSVPDKQIISVDEQKVCLSHERVSFGNLPLFCKSRKSVFMTNVSNHTISYSWHVTTTANQQIIGISPASGKLAPRGSQLIKVLFNSVGDPAFYDIDMICELVDETDKAFYKNSLREWEEEQDRQLNEFTITEKDLDERSNTTKNLPEMVQSKEAANMYNTPQKSKKFKPYKTLPPIIHTSLDIERQEAVEAQRLERAMWPRPMEPKPFLIHLGVIARTHTIDNYQEQFYDEFYKHFVDRTVDAPREGKDVTKPKQKPELIDCSESEGDILSSVIGNVLRTLVDDPDFHSAVTKLSDESTPYFNQFDPERRAKLREQAELEEEQERLVSEAERRAGQKTRVQSDLESTTVCAEPELDRLTQTPTPREIKAALESVQPHEMGATGATGDMAAMVKRMQDSEKITRSPVFGSMVEDILENTLMNILLEAAGGELNITARPRLIALPPRRSTPPNK